MKTYLEISVSVNRHQRELLLPTMIELGCHAFQETDQAFLCYIDITRWTEEEMKSIRREMQSVLQKISANASIQYREIAEENWNEQWEKTIQPIELGERLTIKPSWHRYENRQGRIVIEIDPKMSFGTGYHESTRLVLRLLEKYIVPGCRMLDVGTGTGILVIAAGKLGAGSVVGIDNDEWSIENARENVAANHAGDLVIISNQILDEFANASFDVITVNITMNTIIEMLDEFHRLLRRKGTLLLSGLLQTDEQMIVQQLRRRQFNMLEQLRENEWIALACENSG